jgi:hypothetical protein
MSFEQNQVYSPLPILFPATTHLVTTLGYTTDEIFKKKSVKIFHPRYKGKK